MAAKIIGIRDEIIEETKDCDFLPTHGIGELIIGGPHVVQEYYNNPDAIRKNKIRDSETGYLWHRMGDTGYFDDAGYFWITGRVHSTIYHASGVVLHPQIIEQCFARDGHLYNNGMTHIAAVGVGNDHQAQHCYVVVTVANEACLFLHPWEERLIPELAERAASKGLEIDGIIVWDQAMPLDPRHNSKIIYKKLAQNIQPVLGAPSGRFRLPAGTGFFSQLGT